MNTTNVAVALQTIARAENGAAAVSADERFARLAGTAVSLLAAAEAEFCPKDLASTVWALATL